MNQGMTAGVAKAKFLPTGETDLAAERAPKPVRNRPRLAICGWAKELEVGGLLLVAATVVLNTVHFLTKESEIL
jgi:hypothetical protein